METLAAIGFFFFVVGGALLVACGLVALYNCLGLDFSRKRPWEH